MLQRRQLIIRQSAGMQDLVKLSVSLGQQVAETQVVLTEQLLHGCAMLPTI